MKKVISAITALILSGGLFAGCSRKDGASQVNGNRIQKFRIGLETDISGRGDKGFNDAAVAGLERIKEEFGAEVQIFEPRQADQYESML
ncbi:MAG: BMP family ABC transporter substrate-binding protein, partial [Clostridiaceae bacterium]